MVPFDIFSHKKPRNNSSEAKLHTLKSISQNKDIVIQKGDKGNTTLINDKND